MIIFSLPHIFNLRGIYLKKVGDKKQARNRLKAISPSTDFLFGGNVAELCEAVHHSFALPPATKHQKFATGWKGKPHAYGGFTKSYGVPQEGGFNNPRGGFRGGHRGGYRGKASGAGRGKKEMKN